MYISYTFTYPSNLWYTFKNHHIYTYIYTWGLEKRVHNSSRFFLQKTIWKLNFVGGIVISKKTRLNSCPSEHRTLYSFIVTSRGQNCGSKIFNFKATLRHGFQIVSSKKTSLNCSPFQHRIYLSNFCYTFENQSISRGQNCGPKVLNFKATLRHGLDVLIFNNFRSDFRRQLFRKYTESQTGMYMYSPMINVEC